MPEVVFHCEGMIADVLKALGANLPDLPKLLASIKREMRQDEPENQRVALFCLGIVAQHQPKLFQDHVKLWLQVLTTVTYSFKPFY